MPALSRRRLGAFAAATVASALIASPAFADKASEEYVVKSAQGVLTQLASAEAGAQRTAQFAGLMDKFADMPRIADFVLGKYARTARADAALYKEWNAAFRDYAVAVYEDQLDRYRGRQIKLAGPSQDFTQNGKLNSVVKTEIALPGGQPFLVNWRVIQMPDKTWKVVDVALKLEDNVIWLAIQQRTDFLAQLDKNGGDVRKLIATVKQQTATMRQRVAARRGA